MLEALERIVQNLGFRGDTAGFLVMFGLGMARLVTAVAMAPFLGGRAVPSKVKVGLSAMVMAVLYSSIVPPGAAAQLNPVLLVGLLVKEVMIGATLGLLAQLVFYAVQAAGAIIDTQRGMDQPAFLSPQLPSNVSVLGNFKFQAALVLFLAMDGHLVFLRALHASFRMAPLTTFPQFPAGGTPLAEQMARVSAEMLVVAVQIAAPVAIALFLVDVAFGALGKVAGRINVHAESQPVKSLAGLALVFLSIGFLMERMRDYFGSMIGHIYQFLNAMS